MLARSPTPTIVAQESRDSESDRDSITLNTEDTDDSSHDEKNALPPNNSHEQANAELYGPFSCAATHRWLKRAGKVGNEQLMPSCQVCCAAVAIIDISGLTRLAARMSADHIKVHIKGDVIKFCGNSIMVMWTCSLSRQHDLGAILARCAAECVLTLKAECDHYVSVCKETMVEFSMRCAIGCDIFNLLCIGCNGRWESLAFSKELKAIQRCISLAKQGQTLCTIKARRLLEEYFGFDDNVLISLRLRLLSSDDSTPLSQQMQLTPLSDQLSSRLDGAAVERLLHSPTAEDAQNENLDDRSYCDIVKDLPAATVYETQTRTALFAQRLFDGNYERMGGTAKWMKYFVHESARQCLGPDHVSELRSVVTIFVSLTGLEEAFADGNMGPIQDVLLSVQDILSKFEGSLRQFVVGDKGCVLIANFGVPHFSHEDDCVRAVEAAFSIHDSLLCFEIRTRIGITQGNAYCGLVGTNRRCEYAVMGCSVNLAAGLMLLCDYGEVLIDEFVYRAIKDAYHISTHESVAASGFAEPCAVFSPIQRRQLFGMCRYVSSRSRCSYTTSDGVSIVGNHDKLYSMRNVVEKYKVYREGQLVTVVASAGLGKSRFVTAAIDMLSANGLEYVYTCGRSIHANEQYFIARQFLEELFTRAFGKDNVAGRRSSVTSVNSTSSMKQTLASSSYVALESTKTAIYDWFISNFSDPYEIEINGNVDLVPMSRVLFLFEHVMGIQFPEIIGNTQVAELNDSYHRNKIIVACLEIAMSKFHISLILENVHCIDKPSLAVFEELWSGKSSSPDCLILQTSNDESSCIGKESSRHQLQIRLLPLCIEDSRLLLKNYMPLDKFRGLKEDEIIKLCQSTSGRPSTLRSLATYLSTNSISSIRLDGSTSFHSYIMNSALQRCEQLDPDQYLVLKVASVIGLEFTPEMMIYVTNHAEERDVETMQAIIDLIGMGSICKAPNFVSSKFSIADASLCDVIYDAMLQSQKAVLHRTVGQYYETYHKDDHRYFDTIIYHFSKARVAHKILEYNVKGGSEAKLWNDNKLALKYYSELVSSAVVIDNADEINIPFVSAILQQRASVTPYVAINEGNLLQRFFRTPSSNPKQWAHENSMRFDFHYSDGIYSDNNVGLWISEISSIYLNLSNLSMAHNWDILLLGHFKLPIVTIHTTSFQLLQIRASLALHFGNMVDTPHTFIGVQAYLSLSRMFWLTGKLGNASVAISLATHLVGIDSSLKYSPIYSRVLYEGVKLHLYSGHRSVANDILCDMHRISSFTSDEAIKLLFELASVEMEIADGNWVESAKLLYDRSTILVHQGDFSFAVQLMLESAWAALVGGSLNMCRQLVDRIEVYSGTNDLIAYSQLMWLKYLLQFMCGDFRSIQSLSFQLGYEDSELNENIRHETVLLGFACFIDSINGIGARTFETALTVVESYMRGVLPEFYACNLLIFPSIVVAKVAGAQYHGSYGMNSSIKSSHRKDARSIISRVFNYLETNCSSYPHCNLLMKGLRIFFEDKKGQYDVANNLKAQCDSLMEHMGEGKNLTSLDSPPTLMPFHVGLYHLLLHLSFGVGDNEEREKRKSIVDAWIQLFGGSSGQIFMEA